MDADPEGSEGLEEETDSGQPGRGRRGPGHPGGRRRRRLWTRAGPFPCIPMLYFFTSQSQLIPLHAGLGFSLYQNCFSKNVNESPIPNPLSLLHWLMLTCLPRSPLLLAHQNPMFSGLWLLLSLPC